MTELKVLKSNQVLMGIFGIYPQSLAKYEALNSISPFFMCSLMGASLVLSAIFAYEGSTELSAVLDAVLIFIGESQALAAYFNTRLKMDRVGILVLKLQDVVDRGIPFFHDSIVRIITKREKFF